MPVLAVLRHGYHMKVLGNVVHILVVGDSLHISTIVGIGARQLIKE